MPWKKMEVREQRVEFVVQALRESEPMSRLCEEFGISREDQDRFAAWSQAKTASAQAKGLFAEEIVAVGVPRPKQGPPGGCGSAVVT